MKKGKNISRGKDIGHSADTDFKHNKARLLEEIETEQGLKIEVWNVDFQHALDGHPEVSIERIRKTLKSPIKVVKSKKSNRACLFYTLEIENDPVFGTIFFCVVVVVLREGQGKMETAYETTFIKTGEILFSKGPNK